MKKFNIYSTILAFLFSSALVAQDVTLKTPDMVVAPGDNIHVDVQVENFNLIAGLQFSTNWNQNVLEYIGVDNFGLPNMSTAGNFGTTEVEAGILRFSWFDQAQTGVTLSDMQSIYSIWYKVVGEPGTNAQLTISNSPIEIEITTNVDDSTVVLPVIVENGDITIQDPNASTETYTLDFVLFQNSPNPFTNITYINFDLNRSTQAHLSIYDNTGKVVYENSEYYSSGSHSIPIRRNLFQSAGTYLYSLRTDQGTATRQMIIQ